MTWVGPIRGTRGILLGQRFLQDCRPRSCGSPYGAVRQVSVEEGWTLHKAKWEEGKNGVHGSF